MTSRGFVAVVLVLVMVGALAGGFYFVVHPLQGRVDALESEVFVLKADNARLVEQVRGYENNETVKALMVENSRLLKALYAARINVNVTNVEGWIQAQFTLNGLVFSTPVTRNASEMLNWATGILSATTIWGGNYTLTSPVMVSRSYCAIHGTPQAWILSGNHTAIVVSEDAYCVTLAGLQVKGGGVQMGGNTP